MLSVADDTECDPNSDIELDNQSHIQPQSSLLKFLPEHPFLTTHGTHWIAADKVQIPNFIGATVPRHDHGD